MKFDEILFFYNAFHFIPLFKDGSCFQVVKPHAERLRDSYTDVLTADDLCTDLIFHLLFLFSDLSSVDQGKKGKKGKKEKVNVTDDEFNINSK